MIPSFDNFLRFNKIPKFDNISRFDKIPRFDKITRVDKIPKFRGTYLEGGGGSQRGEQFFFCISGWFRPCLNINKKSGKKSRNRKIPTFFIFNPSLKPCLDKLMRLKYKPQTPAGLWQVLMGPGCWKPFSDNFSFCLLLNLLYWSSV